MSLMSSREGFMRLMPQNSQISNEETRPITKTPSQQRERPRVEPPPAQQLAAEGNWEAVRR